MPIMIPNGLPAAATLAEENIFVMNETRAVTQDIRPLQILVLNLMPTKIATERRSCRACSAIRRCRSSWSSSIRTATSPKTPRASICSSSTRRLRT